MEHVRTRMSKSKDILHREVTTCTDRFVLRIPLRLSGRKVTELTLLMVSVDVETRAGRRARGLGAMPMGNAYDWPSVCATPDRTLATTSDFRRCLVDEANRSC